MATHVYISYWHQLTGKVMLVQSCISRAGTYHSFPVQFVYRGIIYIGLGFMTKKYSPKMGLGDNSKFLRPNNSKILFMIDDSTGNSPIAYLLSSKRHARRDLAMGICSILDQIFFPYVSVLHDYLHIFTC